MTISSSDEVHDDDVWGDVGRDDDEDDDVLLVGFREPERRSWLFTSESARAFQRVSRAAHQRAAIKATNERHCKSRPLYSNDDDTRLLLPLTEVRSGGHVQGTGAARTALMPLLYINTIRCLMSFSTYSSIYYHARLLSTLYIGFIGYITIAISLFTVLHWLYTNTLIPGLL